MRSLRLSRFAPRAAAPALTVVALLFTLTTGALAQDEPPAPPPAEGTVSEPVFERSGEVPAGTIAFTGAANSANSRWLVDLYVDVFLREADTGGLDHWLAMVAAGGDRSRLAVARSFLNSEEGARGEATRAYAEILDRQPDPAGLAYWTEVLRDHPVTSLRFLHMASDEYFNNSGGTNAGFVTNLYQDVLYRSPDAAGLAYHVDLIESGVPRGDVAGAIYLSPESMNNRVSAYYQEILGRAPSPAELAEGTSLIFNDDERAVRANLLAGDEAFETFYAQATAD